MTFEEWYESNVKYMHVHDFKPWLHEAFDAGATHEREACAKVCESFKTRMDAGFDHAAVAIRERNKQ